MLAQGINFLFPVQTSTYDHIYDGHDVIVQASKYGNCLTLKVLIRHKVVKTVVYQNR